jgi:renal tumor antigen
VGVSDEKSKRLALVFELMDKNLYEYIRGRKVPLNQVHVKSIIYQVLKGLHQMHRLGIFHRDIKPENILLQGDKVKLADFGSCKGCFSPQPHTEYISTRWYRPPECLMTDGYYNSAMDVWGLGCVLFEIITFYPLFAGENEMDQINKINQVLGSPSRELLARFQKNYSFTKLSFKELPGSGIEKLLPKESPECVDLLKRMLCYDPDKRITSAQAMAHPFFKEVAEGQIAEQRRKST